MSSVQHRQEEKFPWGGWSEMTVSYCFVLDSKGNKLTPTKENKGWYLIRKKKAILRNEYPMVIQLTKEVPVEELDTSFIHLGDDEGSKYTGISLVQQCQTKNKPVFKGVIEHRQDLKHLMDVRRGHRKYRRSHKEYRQPRFDNRGASKRKKRIAPSIKQKRQAVLRVAKQLSKWCRIDFVHIEEVAIDIRVMQKGYKTYKWQYQKSNRLDENLRKATLMRDQFTCQECRKKECRLEAHHIVPKRSRGNNTIDNLITLCSKCHEKVTGNEFAYVKKYQDMIDGKNVYFSHAQHVMQGKTYLRQEFKEMASVILTNGGETANKRIDWNIKKSHANDAIVITGLQVTPEQCDLKEWKIKPMRCKQKGKVEEVNGFRHRDYVRYTKKNGETYTGYITALYTDKKQCNLTTTDGKILKRYGTKSLKLLWRFNKIYWF